MFLCPSKITSRNRVMFSDLHLCTLITFWLVYNPGDLDFEENSSMTQTAQMKDRLIRYLLCFSSILDFFDSTFLEGKILVVAGDT